MTEFLGISFILFGLFFCLIGVIGLIRFPDIYSRIHAAGKVSTLGLIGLSVAAAFLVPAASLKLVALTGFLIITAPVAAHTVANAAYRSGVKMVESHRDDLAEDSQRGRLPENQQNPPNQNEANKNMPQTS